jgi:hypothetical protein
METLRQLGLVAANVELEDSAIGELKSSLSELSKLDSMQVCPTPSRGERIRGERTPSPPGFPPRRVRRRVRKALSRVCGRPQQLLGDHASSLALLFNQHGEGDGSAAAAELVGDLDARLARLGRGPSAILPLQLSFTRRIPIATRNAGDE